MVRQDRHLIVLSEDAMVYEDLAYLRRLPVFGEVWDRAALVERVRTVYPSVTYPVHTSIRTGVYAGRHGIVNNEKPCLGELSSPWEWFNDAVKAPDLFDAAKRAGLTTAAVYWPATGNHPHIDYLINEYWPQSADDDTLDCFVRSGSSPEVVEKIIRPNLPLLEGKHRKHPYCDKFIMACACAMVRAFRPNLLMIHTVNIDAARHHSGIFSERVNHALHEIDGWLGDLLKAVQDAGMEETTDFAIVSDHGQLNTTRVIAMNAVLADRGLVTVAEQGQVADYVAMIKSSALSAQVYLKHPDSEEDLARVHQVLEGLREEGVWGISRVYTAREAREEEGLYGDFSFVIETDGYTSFSNDWRKPFVRNHDLSDYRFGRATHGHHPDKGPQPPLMAWGPDIQPGVRVARRSIVDEAPTFARILGVDLPDADGAVIEELLR